MSTLDAAFIQAEALDAVDPLRQFRHDFALPNCHPGKDTIYFAGHSLGAQPKQAKILINHELDDWANLGVLGHFDKTLPWWSYHENCTAAMASLVGANANEIAIMNSLTANLHFCLVSFYRPNQLKNKILMEAHAFPSDRYAIQSQVRFHGFDPNTHVIQVAGSDEQQSPSTDVICQAIEQHAAELNCVFLSAVHYLSGQVLDVARVVACAHKYDIIVGIDLAHAAGCMPLACHDWQVDFAVWCNYKYLNAGPGAIGSAFIHDKHVTDASLPRFEGWWGHDKATRFNFVDQFQPIPTAESWQLSNPPIFQLASLKAALDIFESAGMDEIYTKNKAMTDMILAIFASKPNVPLACLSPMHGELRAGLLTFACANAKQCCQYLQQQGIIADAREPNILRIAPQALYNTYRECVLFCDAILQKEN